MKSNTHKSLLLAMAGLLTFTSVSIPDSYRKPFTRQELAGTWVGFDNYRLKYYRLQLDESGTGFCSVVYVDDPAELYRIDSWKFEEELLVFSLSPVDQTAPQIEMKSTRLGVTSSVLTLEVRGKQHGWVREVSLMNEKKYLEKDLRAKQRIEEFRQSQKPSEKTTGDSKHDTKN